MRRWYECGQVEHQLSRRRMLGALAGTGAAALGLGGMGTLLQPAAAADLKSRQKQVLFIWLDGAMSQFESWDPKPHSEFSGPFRAIPTSVPGLQVSELLPNTAKQMHHLSVIRNLHTRFEDHSRAVDPIQRGDPKNRGVDYPFLGSAVTRFLGDGGSGLPPYIHIKPGSGGFHHKDAGFLGARFGSLALGDGKPPSNLLPGPGITETIHKDRTSLREAANRRFRNRRRSADTDTYGYTFELADQLMKRTELFDPAANDPKDVARYGDHAFGRHLLLARRLLEEGTTFVKVTMYHWDTHADNFNFHQDLVGQVDRPFAALMEDLAASGQLEHTLVVMMSEFGRTPKINQKVGRDHWPESWSMCLGGAGLQKGAVLGATNAAGTWVEGDAYDVGHVFHTVFRAIGIDPRIEEYTNNGQPLPVANEECSAIEQLLT